MSDCSPSSTATVPCPGDAGMFIQAFASLLPPGWAWEAAVADGTIMSARSKVIAALMLALHQKACELTREFHCFSVVDTMESWYADYGLPDDCGINDLCAKVIALGGQNCASFVELGALLGFDLCCHDLPPETQAGCWSLGTDQLAPEPNYRFGGSELGYVALPCADPPAGVDLGLGVHGPDECNIAGFFEEEAPAEVQAKPCAPAACIDYDGEYPSGLLPGCLKPYDISHYTGTAFHWIVGLTDDNPGLGSWGKCAPPPSIDQLSLGDNGLGSFVPGIPVPEDYAIGGCWDLGVSELCTPPVEPVMCFVQRYKPAHTVALRRYCDQNGVIA
ncbi:hypothetical protein [uncultured Hyphomicrobium sp.]|uniref:hypothetical protein n=1 Tax=uncultured Hyphomicrobium sp. TaxID=194373 RepID=UPI0025ED52CF|nr:hypothetical protein [uncultured Hyphomicrobium sp.]